MDSLLDTAPCGFLSFADNGTIRTINATLLRWLGYDAGSLDGQSIEVGATEYYRIEGEYWLAHERANPR